MFVRTFSDDIYQAVHDYVLGSPFPLCKAMCDVNFTMRRGRPGHAAQAYAKSYLRTVAVGGGEAVKFTVFGQVMRKTEDGGVVLGRPEVVSAEPIVRQLCVMYEQQVLALHQALRSEGCNASEVMHGTMDHDQIVLTADIDDVRNGTLLVGVGTLNIERDVDTPGLVSNRFPYARHLSMPAVSDPLGRLDPHPWHRLILFPQVGKRGVPHRTKIHVTHILKAACPDHGRPLIIGNSTRTTIRTTTQSG
ncbi:hypothetical protein C8R47DRAFT_1084087 [Mycena vitilis]|nr:hypothetical protein C8R47DRAFT_1084087 [Mycena vitilis]